MGQICRKNTKSQIPQGNLQSVAKSSSRQSPRSPTFDSIDPTALRPEFQLFIRPYDGAASTAGAPDSDRANWRFTHRQAAGSELCVPN